MYCFTNFSCKSHKQRRLVIWLNCAAACSLLVSIVSHQSLTSSLRYHKNSDRYYLRFGTLGQDWLLFVHSLCRNQLWWTQLFGYGHLWCATMLYCYSHSKHFAYMYERLRQKWWEWTFADGSSWRVCRRLLQSRYTYNNKLLLWDSIYIWLILYVLLTRESPLWVFADSSTCGSCDSALLCVYAWTSCPHH